MRAFVTGGTGFVGGYVVRRLIAGGHVPVCLARRDAPELSALGAKVVPGDVADRAALRRGMAGCDRVVHLANVYTLWEPDPSVYWRVNVEGTRDVMEAALEAGVAKVVHVSSAIVWSVPIRVAVEEEVAQLRALG